MFVYNKGRKEVPMGLHDAVSSSRIDMSTSIVS